MKVISISWSARLNRASDNSDFENKLKSIGITIADDGIANRLVMAQTITAQSISCLISCPDISTSGLLPSSSDFATWSPISGIIILFVGIIGCASWVRLRLARMKPQLIRTPKAMARTTPITMPATAPEERADKDLDVPGLADSGWEVEVAAAAIG